METWILKHHPEFIVFNKLFRAVLYNKHLILCLIRCHVMYLHFLNVIYSLIYFVLEVIGLWPKPEQARQKKYIRYLYSFSGFLAIALVIVFPETHSFIRIYGDIRLMIDNLQYALPCATCLPRIIIFWQKQEDLVRLVCMMSNDWRKPKSPWEETRMIQRAQTARLIISIAYVLMAMGLALIFIPPVFGISMRYQSNIIDSGRLLPFKTYDIHDVTKNSLYVLIFTAQSITALFCAMVYCGVDSFMSMVIFHISGQLDILSHNLMYLKSNGDFNNALKKCVMDHERLLSAIAVIKSTFDELLFVLFVYSGILFAFYGFLVITLFKDGRLLGSDLAYLLILLGNALGYICVYCAVGDVLTAQCDQVHQAVYYNKWYNSDPKHTKNIVLLMIRTSRSLHLTAGKVFPLTMVTFCNLLKTSAGYISILLATRK